MILRGDGFAGGQFLSLRMRPNENKVDMLLHAKIICNSSIVSFLVLNICTDDFM